MQKTFLSIISGGLVAIPLLLSTQVAHADVVKIVTAE
jgi:hypothetical protein